jgi:hypothetical protein
MQKCANPRKQQQPPKTATAQTRRSNATGIPVLCALVVAVSLSSAQAETGTATEGKATRTGSTKATAAKPQSTKEKPTLKGGTEGTSFESLVIEGEDRVQVEFTRPELDLQLDPREAMGFDFGDVHEVVERVVPDLQMPLLRLTARQRSPYTARPWLYELASGPVARFRPELDNVESWSLQIADSRSQTVRVFEGKGKPPREIEWDGQAMDGGSALPGLTYSYSLEAFDRAGNKRTFVGDGFQVPSYRTGEDGFRHMVIGGQQLGNDPNATSLQTPHVLLDAASWINQAGMQEVVQVVATARTYEQADALGHFVSRHLLQNVVGPESRMIVQTEVQPTAPARGAVTLEIGEPAGQ